MHNNVQEQIKEALKAKDEVRLTVLRNMLSSFTNESVNLKRTPQDKLSDDEAIVVIKRLVKQRKDSIEQFKKGNREDLVKTEEAELEILERFLPAQMSEEEIRKIAINKKQEVFGVNGFDKLTMGKESGKFMGQVMKEVAGKADGMIVKKIVEEVLSE